MAASYYILKILKKKHAARKLRQISNRNIITDTKVNTACIPDNTLTCRVCLKEGRIPIFGDKDQSDISQDVSLFGDILIVKNDSCPQYLCHACKALLDAAILFRKTAKQSAIILQKGLEKPEAPLDNDEYNHEISDREVIHCNENKSQSLTVKSYNCMLCKQRFRTNEEYVRHRSSREHKNVRIECSICNRLLTAQLYKKHLIRHQTASHLICEVCGKLYRKDNLIRHLQLHSFDLPFQCQICPYRGRFMESLRIHMRTHTGDKPFSCDKCQLRFLTRSNLNRHLLTHRKERPFKCTECGRGFYTKCDMDVHFKSDHVGIKDFGCRMCGSKYGTRKALMRHELRVHKRDKMAKGRVPLYLQSEYRRQEGDVPI